MTKITSLAALAVGIGLVASTPAAAVVTTFASFSPIGTGANVRWVNNGGGSIYTTATANSNPAGTRAASFSFLNNSLAPLVTNVTSNFTLLASVANQPATLQGNILTQSGLSGSFSFVSTSAITAFGVTYAAGSNLLSGTFSGASISGVRLGSTGSFVGTTLSGGTVTYVSDFLDFGATGSRDFALSLGSITPVLQALPINLTPTRALRNFRAVAGGAFSSDPGPLVNGEPIPEPESWALLIAGLGLVGVAARRRRRPVEPGDFV
jgi:PEP-CTERM motif